MMTRFEAHSMGVRSNLRPSGDRAFMNIKPEHAFGICPRILGLILALSPVQALAWDLTPDPSRVISDPAYLPPGGRLYGITEFSYGQTYSDTNNYQGAFHSSNNTSSTTVTETLEFGVADDLTLKAYGSPEMQESTTNYANGASTVTYSEGFDNPTFGVVWRALDQKADPLNWDLIGTYSPNLAKDKDAAAEGLEGNMARGGDTASLGTALSYKTKGFTLYVSGTAVYLDNRDVLNQTDGIITTYQSSWQYGALLSTQTRFDDFFSFNASVSQTFGEPADASNVNTGGKLIAFTNQPGDDTTLSAAVNFHVKPGWAVASLIYTHFFYGDSGYTYAAQADSNTTTINKGEDALGVEMRYLF
jgi:hypothetical protein